MAEYIIHATTSFDTVSGTAIPILNKFRE